MRARRRRSPHRPRAGWSYWPSPRQPPAAGGAGHGVFPALASLRMATWLPVSRGAPVLGSGPAARPGGREPDWTARTAPAWRPADHRARRAGAGRRMVSYMAAARVASGLAGGHQDHLVWTFGFTGHGRSGRQGWASAEGVPVRWNLRRPT